MPNYADLQDRKSQLIRKALEGSIFRAPASSPVITAITDATGLLELPTGYEDVGWITKGDGVTWTREFETSNVTSWGAAEPTRRDVTTDQSGLQFTMQETKKSVLELYHSVDLSAVEASADSGEVMFDKPDRPITRYDRFLAMFRDGDGADTIYIARWLPRGAVTEVGEQQWVEESEDGVTYPVTLSAYRDDTVGTSMRYFFGGPGWLALLDDMGFTQASA